MLPSEYLRLTLFLTLVGTVYVLAAVSLVRRARRGRWPGRPRDACLARASLVLAAAGLACMAYGYWVEPSWLEVTRVRLTSPKLPKGARPIRIAYFGDLHSGRRPRLEERLPEVIAAEKPDLIFFAGDALSEPQGLAVFRACMSRLARVAPTFAVRGNWDTRQEMDLFGGTGVRELDGRPVSLQLGSSEVWVAGLPVGGEWRIGQTLDAIPPNAFTIFVFHTPDEIEEAARRKVDLYCAAHTHGGQVALPFYGALITLSKFGKRFEAGLYRVDRTWMYVNRGIGESGDVAPRFRFCARPEVTIIEVAPD
jgi:hypothetical protein